MSVVLPSEWEDFERALKRHGYAITDFKVEEHEDPPAAPEFHHKGTIDILHMPSSVQKSYRAGWGTSWVADFEDDLQKHVFRAS